MTQEKFDRQPEQVQRIGEQHRVVARQLRQPGGVLAVEAGAAFDGFGGADRYGEFLGHEGAELTLCNDMAHLRGTTGVTWG